MGKVGGRVLEHDRVPDTDCSHRNKANISELFPQFLEHEAFALCSPTTGREEF